MKYLFGKSKCAVALEELVSSDPYMQAKVMRHISEYNEYIKQVSEIKDEKIRNKAIMYATLECDLSVSDKIKSYIRNVKLVSRREALNGGYRGRLLNGS